MPNYRYGSAGFFKQLQSFAEDAAGSSEVEIIVKGILEARSHPRKQNPLPTDRPTGWRTTLSQFDSVVHKGAGMWCKKSFHKGSSSHW